MYLIVRARGAEWRAEKMAREVLSRLNCAYILCTQLLVDRQRQAYSCSIALRNPSCARLTGARLVIIARQYAIDNTVLSVLARHTTKLEANIFRLCRYAHNIIVLAHSLLLSCQFGGQRLQKEWEGTSPGARSEWTSTYGGTRFVVVQWNSWNCYIYTILVIDSHLS